MVTRTGWWLRRRGSFMLALTLALVVLADFLFYRAPVGWTAGLYLAALLTALAMRSTAWLATQPGRLLGVASFALGLTMLVDPSPLAVILSGLGLITLAMTDRQGWTHSATRWLLRWIAFVWQCIQRPWHDLALLARLRQWRHRQSHSTQRWLEWLVALAAGGLFVLLFAVANPVVEWLLTHGWQHVWSRLMRLPEMTPPARVGLWAATLVGVWGLLRIRPKLKKPAPPWRPSPLDAADDHLSLITRCLVVFNVIFLAQMLLDGVYLIGRVQLPQGMTYAQYAHRGAYPLMATALLAGLLVLATFRPGGAAQGSVWTRRLVLAWIAQNVLLMLAAAWRLNLYIEAYSLSRWRVAAAIWLLLVAIGLIWLLWRIAADRSSLWLVNRVALSAVVVLYSVCFVDVDGFIARYNVEHCRETRGQGATLDVAYLTSLGYESLPALCEFANTSAGGPSQRTAVTQAIVTLQRQLGRDMRNWRGWTARRSSLNVLRSGS